MSKDTRNHTTVDPHVRYARHLALPRFGEVEQQRLQEARVLIVGLGGLGSPCALYLAAAGVGTLVLNDFDTVDASNLQRQILHNTNTIGQPKTTSAKASLKALNPDTRLVLLEERLLNGALEEQAALADVILDCSDNFGTRYALNAASLVSGTPLVSGAAIRFQGQLTVFDPREPKSPCYACLYDEAGEGLEDCQSNGVLGPVPGVIGCMQAVEALKLITGLGETLVCKLLLYDGFTGSARTSSITRDPLCPQCGNTDS